MKYFMNFFGIKVICKIDQIKNRNAQFENYEKRPPKKVYCFTMMSYIGFTTLASCKSDFILSFQFAKGSFITITTTKGVPIRQVISLDFE
jgi:hypothetical protein